MELIKRGDLRLLLADEDKHIRAINDVYEPEHYEDGELIPEHYPSYSEMIFIGKQVDDAEIPQLYVEEWK